MKKNFWILMLGAIFLSAVVLCRVYWVNYRPDEVRLLCKEEQQMNAQRPKRDRRIRSYEQCIQENGISR